MKVLYLKDFEHVLHLEAVKCHAFYFISSSLSQRGCQTVSTALVCTASDVRVKPSAIRPF